MYIVVIVHWDRKGVKIILGRRTNTTLQKYSISNSFLNLK